jgi:Rrf2 family cysteine metabolism transcriptional repressor
MKTQKVVSKKCEYALRAVFELACNRTEDPMKIQDIASAQGIPSRFLEIILVELKNGGFVLSKRGNSGGYTLARDARDIHVGEVIRFFQGRLGSPGQDRDRATERVGDIAFSRLWERAQAAISEVYEQTTIYDLVEEEAAYRCTNEPNYVI